MSTTMITLVLLVSLAAIIFILIYIHNKHKEKEKNRLLDQFSRLGASYDLSFSSQEFFTYSILGLDGIRRKLLYIEAKENQFSHMLIDLEQVKSCSLKKNYQNLPLAGNKDKGEAQVQDIVLQFAFHNEKEPVSIPIYNLVWHNIYQMAELETKAKEWQTMLSKMLNTKKEQRA